LASIAQRNHTTVQNLRSTNHLARNSVNYGSILKIPSAAANPSAKSLILAKASRAAESYHTVKKGDTFYNIARRYAVSPKELASWNRVSLNAALTPGRKLTIKGREQQVASSSNSLRLIRYTVRKGDTLTQLSRKFNISVTDLRKSNAVALSKGLQPGQTLKVLVDSSHSTI